MGRVKLGVDSSFLWFCTLTFTFLLGLWVTPTVWSLPAAQIGGGQPPSDKAKTGSLVPFSMLPSNHMLVQAAINGKGPYHLIFDLGAPVTLLSNQAAETSGVVQAEAPRSFPFSMRGEAEISQLQVGSLTVTKLPVLVFDHPALKALSNALGRPIDGIMGFTFFARFRTTIDYQTHQMTFVPVDFQIRDLLRELPDRLMGPKTVRHRILAPKGLWGLQVARGKPDQETLGVRITQVLPESPAFRAGLKVGDILTALGNRWTTSIADTYAAAENVEPHKDTQVTIIRNGKEQVLTIRPEDGI